MRVLIFHGYLLRGTGSNIYNANLAQALARLGHEVHLLCQDHRAAELGWVSELGHWERGELRVTQLRSADASGRVCVYLPPIGELLPVYVRDEYEGFRVKEFAELSDEELSEYIDANAGAAREVIARAGGVDAALANHLVMGPLILARSEVGFAAKIHGSALEYTVKPHRRFLPHAREGMRAARGVLVGSRHTAESLWEALEVPGLEARTRLGPPGVDTREFRPREPARAERALTELSVRLAKEGAGEAFGRVPEAAAGALRTWAEAPGPRVVLVGKLIVSKGVDLLLAAWPLVHRRHPGASLLIIGFGSFEQGIRRLLRSLAEGDLDGAGEVASAGRALEGGVGGRLQMLESFLSGPPPGYSEAARAAAGSVALSGRLEHGEVAELLPAADLLVMPSTFPESFGMVAVEAAACGVLPISAEHSGMREVSQQLAAALPPDLASLTSFALGEGAVGELAAKINAWLEVPGERRRELGGNLARRAEELWSWEGVARGVLAASGGRLDELLVP